MLPDMLSELLLVLDQVLTPLHEEAQQTALDIILNSMLTFLFLPFLPLSYFLFLLFHFPYHHTNQVMEVQRYYQCHHQHIVQPVHVDNAPYIYQVVWPANKNINVHVHTIITLVLTTLNVATADSKLLFVCVH